MFAGAICGTEGEADTTLDGGYAYDATPGGFNVVELGAEGVEHALLRLSWELQRASRRYSEKDCIPNGARGRIAVHKGLLS